jgi:hypothetical protein
MVMADSNKRKNGPVRRPNRTESNVRREALKTLVPLVHREAHDWAGLDDGIAKELRSLADRMDSLGERGSDVVLLAAFWGASVLVH